MKPSSQSSVIDLTVAPVATHGNDTTTRNNDGVITSRRSRKRSWEVVSPHGNGSNTAGVAWNGSSRLSQTSPLIDLTTVGPTAPAVGSNTNDKDAKSSGDATTRKRPRRAISSHANESGAGSDDEIESSNDSAKSIVDLTSGVEEIIDSKPNADEVLARRLQREQHAELARQPQGDVLVLDGNDTAPVPHVAAARTYLPDDDDCKPSADEVQQLQKDRALAMQMMQEDDDIAQAMIAGRREACEAAMDTTSTGKAWRIVERILKLMSEKRNSTCIEAVARDDLVFNFDKMLQAQEEFRQAGAPTRVDIGYHYTNGVNMSNIQTDGLMTRLEREQNKIQADRFNGAAYGEGIYTGDDPQTFSNYGDVGLVVARLTGVEMTVQQAGRDYKNGNNSITQEFPKGSGGSTRLVVLQHSKQCVAMARYPKQAMLQDRNFQATVVELQGLVDGAFNEGLPKNASIPNAPSVAAILPASYPLSTTVATRARAAALAPNPNFNAAAFPPYPSTTNATLTQAAPNRGSNSMPTWAYGNAALANIIQRRRARLARHQATSPAPSQSFARAGGGRLGTPNHLSLRAQVAPQPPAPRYSGTGGNTPAPIPSHTARVGRRLRASNRTSPRAQVASQPPSMAFSLSPVTPMAPGSRSEIWGEVAPSSLLKVDLSSTTSQLIRFVADTGATSVPSSSRVHTKYRGRSDEECSICLCSMLSKRVACLNKCKHEFHVACFNLVLEKKETKCPLCRLPFSEPRGKMPSGTMSISFSSYNGRSGLSGPLISINYAIPSGIQSALHDSPGQRFEGAHRTAYLPDTHEGRKLLTRLAFAFSHGLTFVIGTSLTTGQNNVVTWSSIHHKTSLAGGTHGYPDPNYFSNCNSELDSLGVPKAQD